MITESFANGIAWGVILFWMPVFVWAIVEGIREKRKNAGGDN